MYFEILCLNSASFPLLAVHSKSPDDLADYLNNVQETSPELLDELYLLFDSVEEKYDIQTKAGGIYRVKLK